MGDDKVKKFIESGGDKELEECTKVQLKLVVDHFGLKLRSSRVAERRIEIMAQLKAREEVSEEGPPQVPASVGGNRSDEGSSRGSSGSSKRSMKLEMMKMQLEAQLKREEREAQLKREEREAQLKREEREAQLKQEEHEREAQLKREEREAQLQREEGERQLRREGIKAKKEVEMRRAERGLLLVSARRDDPKVRERDLPTFDPLEAEAFFDHFERIATLKEWPEEDWAALVQSRLTGEAREAYNMLDLEECAVYDMIKKAVLQSYRLTPKVYRKCFRECTRASGRSYAETARDMERRFLRWLKAEEVETMEELKQLMVMERFMSMLHPELRVRIKEAGIRELKAAADRADLLEEALHLGKEGPPRHSPHPRFGGNVKSSGGARTGGDSPKNSARSEVSRSKSSGEPVKKPQGGGNTGTGAGARNAARETTTGGARRTQGTAVSGGVARVTGGESPPRRVRCFNCGGRGHFARECGRPRQRGNVALVRMDDQGAKNVLSRSPLEREEKIHPFICEGAVKIKEADPIPVKMLRDTGADFTLVSETLFPEGYEDTSVGEAMVTTVGGPLRMPLHEVILDSDYGCKTLVVGSAPRCLRWRPRSFWEMTHVGDVYSQTSLRTRSV
nr:golgin subfamily A member 6-like protein 2 [Procambarus clarkii]